MVNLTGRHPKILPPPKHERQPLEPKAKNSQSIPDPSHPGHSVFLPSGRLRIPHARTDCKTASLPEL